MASTGQPTVVVLAAGRGQRFRDSGGAVHKLDAPLNGIPVLQRVLAAVEASGLPFHVVRSGGDSASARDGMGDSIARGVAATPDSAGWLILPGDLALVHADSLVQVARGLASHPVVLPHFRGQQGHPVGFGAHCFASLTSLRGDTGAAAIVRAHQQTQTMLALHLDDPGIVMDIDTPDDLARAEAWLASASTAFHQKVDK